MHHQLQISLRLKILKILLYEHSRVDPDVQIPSLVSASQVLIFSRKKGEPQSPSVSDDDEEEEDPNPEKSNEAVMEEMGCAALLPDEEEESDPEEEHDDDLLYIQDSPLFKVDLKV